MKLYFEDGIMNLTNPKYLPEFVTWCPDGYYGYEEFCYTFKELERYDKDTVIYTNYVPVFDFASSFWNDVTNSFDIYFRGPDRKWHLIDVYTDKYLKKTHNIGKMYNAGEFGHCKEERTVEKELKNGSQQ